MKTFFIHLPWMRGHLALGLLGLIKLCISYCKQKWVKLYMLESNKCKSVFFIFGEFSHYDDPKKKNKKTKKTQG